MLDVFLSLYRIQIARPNFSREESSRSLIKMKFTADCKINVYELLVYFSRKKKHTRSAGLNAVKNSPTT